MDRLPSTPSVLLDEAPPLTEAEKIREMRTAFFRTAIEICGEDAVELTRLGIAAAGDLAGVLFGSLYPEGGQLASQARKRAQTDMARHFLQGIASARDNAKAAAQKQDEG